MTKGKRIDYLDMARGIGILLVVIGHVSYVSEPVRQYISTFHMPLFFVISGIILFYKQEEQNSLRNLFVKRFKGLMIPYFICSICIFFIESCRIIWKDANNWENVFHQLFQSLCLQGVSVLWFLPALFMSELLFISLRKKSSHLLTVVCLIVICISTYFGALIVQEYCANPDGLKATLFYDVVSMLIRNLFCVGLVGSGYYFTMIVLVRSRFLFSETLLAVALLVLTGVVLKQNGSVDLRGMNLGNLLWFLTGGVSGAMGAVFLSRVLEKLPINLLRHFLIYLGSNSLLIMVTHLDFRILYISIMLVERINNVCSLHAGLFCILIVLFVLLIEMVVITLVRGCRLLLQKKKRQNS